MSLSGKAEPLGAFFAAFTAIELVRLIEGKTRAILVLAPVAGILGGSLVGIWAGIPITHLLQYLGEAMNWATQQKPLLMGITVSVLMGIFITLPLNSVALAVSPNLTGLAAGAATIGCCCSMRLDLPLRDTEKTELAVCARWGLELLFWNFTKSCKDLLSGFPPYFPAPS